jgi:hypothetical protein
VHAAAGVIEKTVPPMYDHQMKHKNTPHHKQVRNDDATISEFFEITGTKAHCLFDSGCEGMMLSPDFTRATGVKTFSLECPIGLQLACIGSRSTINYGANATIMVGSNTVDQYFDITNIDFMMSYWVCHSYSIWASAWTSLGQAVSEWEMKSAPIRQVRFLVRKPTRVPPQSGVPKRPPPSA